MTAAIEHRCRRCNEVRTPPIEGPCPHCGGYYRTIQKRLRSSAEQDEPPEEAPISAEALFRRHENDPVLERRPTGLAGVDHVFGGGLPPSGTILLSAKEGTGKTSFLWELFLTLAAERVRTLYNSSEQSKKDLVGQFRRFGQGRVERAGSYLKIAAQKDFLGLLDLIESRRVQVVAIDSLHLVDGVLDDHDQPMRSGSAGAVERIARDMKELASQKGFLAFLVGHMNNDGTMAGGSHLRHVVDATLGLHPMTESLRDPRRVLRFETKTRFGEMGREALFRMTDEGFLDCGPILDEAEEDKEEPALRPKVPRRPQKDGQVIHFPGKKRPPAGDDEEPPEPPAAA